MAVRNLHDAFVKELGDAVGAENEISVALQKLRRHAASEELQEYFDRHRDTSEAQIARLELAFEMLRAPVRASHCEGISGIVEEFDEFCRVDANPHTMDVTIVAIAQKIEHYEMAMFGTLCSWAKLLAYPEVEKLLRQSLLEAKEGDQHLTQLAHDVNRKAVATE